MLPPDLARFALRLAWQQVRRRARRSLGAWCGILGGLVLVLVQLGFQGGLLDSAVRLHRWMDGEVVVLARAMRSFRDIDWITRTELGLARGHPEVASARSLLVSPLQVRNTDSSEIVTFLAIGVDLDDPAVRPELLDGQAERLRLPGRALYDLRSKPATATSSAPSPATARHGSAPGCASFPCSTPSASSAPTAWAARWSSRAAS